MCKKCALSQGTVEVPKGPLEVSNESKWVGAKSWAKVTDAVTLEQNHQLLSCKLA